jgi:hypothetical protein
MKTFSIGAPSVDEVDVCWMLTLVLVAHASRSVETWYIICLAYAKNSPLITRNRCVRFRPWSTSHYVTALLNLAVPSCTLRHEQKCQLCMFKCGYNLARFNKWFNHLSVVNFPFDQFDKFHTPCINYITTNTLSFIDALLLYYCSQHVSTTQVVIFRMIYLKQEYNCNTVEWFRQI